MFRLFMLIKSEVPPAHKVRDFFTHGENIKCFSTACGLTPRPAKTFKKLFIQTAFKYNFRQIQNNFEKKINTKILFLTKVG